MKAPFMFPNDIRSYYYDRERETKIKADIIIGTKTGTNLLPAFTQNIEIEEDTNIQCYIEGNFENGQGIFSGECYSNATAYVPFVLENMEEKSLSAGTYTFTLIRKSQGDQTSSQKYGMKFYALDTQTQEIEEIDIPTSTGPSYDEETISVTKTFSHAVTLLNSSTYHYYPILYFYNTGPVSSSHMQVFDEEFKFMINAGSQALEWEEASGGGQVPEKFTIGEGGNCAISNFYVDETADIYNEKLPFSELTIEVDNLDGYFSDFTDNSIVSNLNKNCYVDFYLKIANTDWCKSWTMQYDSLQADNQKATLKFKPYCQSFYDSMLYDKNKDFTKFTWAVTSSTNDFKQYVLDNYNITLTSYISALESLATPINRKGFKTLSNVIMYYQTMLASMSNKAKMMVIENNKEFAFWELRSLSYEVQIPYNFLLEKPLLTKETLDEITIKDHEVKSYSNTTYNYQKTISSSFVNTTDILVIYGDEYDFTGISTNDITMTNGTLVSLNTTQSGGVAGLGKHYLILEISGNVGDTYKIEINANLRKEDTVEDKEEIRRKTGSLSVLNYVKIDNKMTSSNLYWTELQDKLDKKIEINIPALPFLQVGDHIQVEYEDETTEIFMVAELHTTWSDGFKMKIIGYHLDNN